MAESVARRLRDANPRPDELSPADFDTMAGSQGSESVVAEIVADTPIALRDGPVKLAIPAYQSFETAGDGSEQTFTLSHGVVDSPDTQDVVVWFGGDYQGVPQINHDTGEITVDGPGSVETVHVFYLSPKPATLELRKETANGNTRLDLWNVNVGLVHQTNQSEQPERFAYGDGFRRFIATDMALQLTVDAPYVTRFEDPDGDGATATNALVELKIRTSDRSIEGLQQVVEDEM